MTAPTAPSPERQPADSGVRERLFQMVVDCEADPERSLMLSSSVAAEHARDLRAILSTPAPQAQPDARAVSHICNQSGGGPLHTILFSEVEGFSGKDCYTDERRVHLKSGRSLRLRKTDYDKIVAGMNSAPAADDGWRPSREEVARAIRRHVHGNVIDMGPPHYSRPGLGINGVDAAVDAILALHPAAPTDEVGKT